MHKRDGPPLMHHLKGLSFEDCWSIFVRKAFGGDGAKNNADDLEEIGKRSWCENNALGGLMHTKNSRKEWELLRKSEVWKKCENDTKILPALKLSYDDLPLFEAVFCLLLCVSRRP
uniref:Uncharacterized protein n=1 Tax=Nelumbo nucifera TaxID=4432 RepID=A0A822ZWP5_NELNU|nr:TPA_asm: hypothetical protein HUJ06_004567 [Nelumbo nucifera]